MNITDVAVGSFFRRKGWWYIRTVPVKRIDGDQCTYYAIDIITGEPAFLTGVSSEVEVKVMAEKPDWATPATGSLRFDTKEQREETMTQLREKFPHTEFTWGASAPEGHFIGYRTTVAVKRQIIFKFGGE